METDKLILEIYGKVSSTEADMKHLISNQTCLEGKVDKLHERVDGHDNILKYFLGAAAVIGAVLAVAYDWVKTKLGAQ